MRDLTMTGPARAHFSEDTGIENEFLRLTEAYAAFVRKEGIAILPYRSPALTLFSALDAAKKRAVIEELRIALEVFGQMEAEGYRLTDSPKLLWRAMRRLGLTPCADIFGRITSEDVVIVFSPDHKTIFFNLRFLEFHSYTVEDVYCLLWHRDSRREDWAREALLKAVTPVFAGEIRESFDPGVPRHIVEETITAGKIRLWIKVKCFSPVTRNGQVAGVIVLTDMEFVEPDPSLTH